MSSLVNTWVRLSTDRLVRADRIVEVDLWGPPNGDKQTEVVHGEPARIMLHVAGDAEEPWREAATVNAERGGELITYLLSLMNSPNPEAVDQIRYVYGLQRDGEVYRWMHGKTMPVVVTGTEKGWPLHWIPDPAPGRDLAQASGQ